MAQPIDYTLNIPSPKQDIMGGIGQALSLKSMMEQREMSKESHAQQMSMGRLKEQEFLRQVELDKQARANAAARAEAARRRQAVLGRKTKEIANNPNMTGKEIFKTLMEFPELKKTMDDAYSAMSETDKKELLDTSIQVESALTANRPDIANDILDTKIEAAENAGDDKKAATLKSNKSILNSSPEAAVGISRLWQVQALGADKYTENRKRMAEATATKPKDQYKVLTPDEKKKLGLDPILPFQIASDGKISQIGSKGVTVNVGGKGDEPQFGTIPKGFMMKKDEKGNWSMSAVPGSPEDKKAKSLAKKKGKQRVLEERAQNVVLEDIDRLKGKIEKSAWYTPMFGVSGYVASLVPGTERVDSEQLAKTITANIGFDRLQQMREASPTGGALGSVSERELTTLQAVLGNLEFSQSEGQLLKNLDRLDKIYKNILEKASAYPNAEEFGFTETTVTETATDDGWQATETGIKFKRKQ